MPRISLWREQKGHDYKFFDNRVREQFIIGGTDINIHKYLGSDSGSGGATPNYTNQSEKNIQDLLFVENRDRIYDPDVYALRGHYNVSDMDFDLSQFGLFLQNDTLFITFHLNDMIERIGRKLMSGDVIELPHLRDEFPLDEDIPVGLKKYYVIQDATRASEGYSPTWYTHLWRVKATPMVDSQEYQDILDNIVDDETDNPLGDLLSTYNQEISINDAVVEQALDDVPAAGYDTTPYYTVPVQENGLPNETETPFADTTVVYTDNGIWTADADTATPKQSAYSGYLTGDGVPPNGFSASAGIDFPSDPAEGAYALRLDYYPNRLFRFNGNRWVKVEDAVRYAYQPEGSQSQLGSFVENNNQFKAQDGRTYHSRQSLSEAIKPKADE